MKATELMIGDWVLYKSDRIENAFLVQITQGMFCDELVRWSYRFEPISLDSEIMNKFGFECSYDDYHQWYIETNHNNLWLEQSRTEPHTYFMRVFNDLKVRYVHELQHVLRLCGIEKTIEL